MDKPVVAALRARRIDVLTVNEAALAGRPDEEQLTFATSVGRTVLTFNQRDYCRLHEEWMEEGRTHTGIIVGAQQRYSVGESVRRLLLLIESCTAEDMRDRIEFLSSWSG